MFVVDRRFRIQGSSSARLARSLGLTLSLSACAPATGAPPAAPAVAPATAPPAAAAVSAAALQAGAQPPLPAVAEPCKGQLSPAPAGFAPIDAPELISRAKKGPGQGGVCDARTFEVKGNPSVYRAFNSTDPRSKLGAWWALDEPSGTVSAYRRDYQICYQYSPLDRLVKCTLREGAKVVIGTGQSVVCSEHLSYATSASLQLYIVEPAADVLNCVEFDALLSWRPTPTSAPRDVPEPAETLSVRED